jgi:hypothetical protein|tara:strand:- start:156 stop:446 length:291 start_codon:yes stop_codon:yes gene_type:complete
MKAEQKNKALIGLDNFKRGSDEEENLNSAFSALFGTDIGLSVLQYLKSITIDSVGGPEISDNSLRHLEGQRYIVGLIQRRINKGKSQKIVKENIDG